MELSLNPDRVVTLTGCFMLMRPQMKETLDHCESTKWVKIQTMDPPITAQSSVYSANIYGDFYPTVGSLSVQYFNSGVLYSVSVAFYEGFFTNPDYPHTQDISTLETIRANYADGGFVDDMGNQITPRVSVGREEVTLADWIAHGGFNPLDPDGWAKWQTGQRTRGKFAQHGTVTETGIELANSFEVKPGTGDGGMVSLSDWYVNLYRTNFNFVLDVPLADELTAAGIASHTPVVAMVAWLNSLRTAGDVVPANLSSVAERRFTIGEHSFTLSFFTTATHTNTSFVGRLSLSGSGSIPRDQLMTLLSGQVAINAGVDIDIPHALGSGRTPAKTKRLILGESALAEHNRSPVFEVSNDGSNVVERVHIGSFRVVDHDDLGDHPTAVMTKVLPTPAQMPLVGEIHFRGAANSNLQVLPPTQACENSGVARVIRIDNQGTGNYTVLDWAGNNIITLRPTQSISLRFVFDREGGGHLLGDQPERLQITNSGDTGIFWSNYSYDYDATHYGMPPRAATPQLQRR